MPRIYADLPKFKRVHQALMETMRQHDVALQEIEKALSGRGTAEDKAALESLRQQCQELKKQYLAMIKAFVQRIE